MLTPEYIKFAEAQLLEDLPLRYEWSISINQPDSDHRKVEDYIESLPSYRDYGGLSKEEEAEARLFFLLFVLESEGVCI